MYLLSFVDSLAAERGRERRETEERERREREQKLQKKSVSICTYSIVFGLFLIILEQTSIIFKYMYIPYSCIIRCHMPFSIRREQDDKKEVAPDGE